MLTPAPIRRSTIERQVASLFRAPVPSGTPGRVGIELERIPAGLGTRAPDPVPAAAMREMLAADPTLREDACISFEPGGQLEISSPPLDSVSGLLDQVNHLKLRVGRCLLPNGVDLFSSGINPWHSLTDLGLQALGPRYTSMQAHFDTIGPGGRRMMRQTASLQICLDLGPPSAAETRWRVANLAGPALSAAFANSPIAAGERGSPGTRSEVWQATDPSRTGFGGEQVGDLVEATYLEFAMKASFIPLTPRGHPPPQLGVSFADWLNQDERRLDHQDLVHHLSTLFPPVRPRGHLEVRYLDALPDRWVPVPIILLSALLYDDAALHTALELLDDGSLGESSWTAAAVWGMRDGGLRDKALALFDLALRALPRFPAGYMPAGADRLLSDYRERYPDSRRCPADDQAEGHRLNSKDLSIWK